MTCSERSFGMLLETIQSGGNFKYLISAWLDPYKNATSDLFAQLLCDIRKVAKYAQPKRWRVEALRPRIDTILDNRLWCRIPNGTCPITGSYIRGTRQFLTCVFIFKLSDQFWPRSKINKGRRYSSYRKCVASVSWGHALSVGIQHTASIGLAVNIHLYFYFLRINYSIIFSASFIDNIFPARDPFQKCKNIK